MDNKAEDIARPLLLFPGCYLRLLEHFQKIFGNNNLREKTDKSKARRRAIFKRYMFGWVVARKKIAMQLPPKEEIEVTFTLGGLYPL